MEAHLAPIPLTYVEEDVGPPLNRGDGSRDLDREFWCRERDGNGLSGISIKSTGISKDIGGVFRGGISTFHTEDRKAYDSDD